MTSTSYLERARNRAMEHAMLLGRNQTSNYGARNDRRNMHIGPFFRVLLNSRQRLPGIHYRRPAAAQAVMPLTAAPCAAKNEKDTHASVCTGGKTYCSNPPLQHRQQRPRHSACTAKNEKDTHVSVCTGGINSCSSPPLQHGQCCPLQQLLALQRK